MRAGSQNRNTAMDATLHQAATELSSNQQPFSFVKPASKQVTICQPILPNWLILTGE